MKRFLAILPTLLAVLLGNARAADPMLDDLGVTPKGKGEVAVQVTVTTKDMATSVVFKYARQPGGAEQATDPVAVAIQKEELVTKSLTGLIGGQTYIVRAEATRATPVPVLAGPRSFTVAAFDPTLKVLPASHAAAGKVTLKGTITANGTPGNAYFKYGPKPSEYQKTDDVPILATDLDKSLSFDIPGDLREMDVLSFVVEFRSESGKITTSTMGKTNARPVAVADSATVVDAEPLTIDVLDNDSDVNGDSLTIRIATPPLHGAARVEDDMVVYTPDGTLAADSFAYAIDDGFKGGTATATVTIRSLRATLAGTHGSFVLRDNGKEAGYFRLTVMEAGSFSGAVSIDGRRYALMGVLSPAGTFEGFATGDGRTLAVSFTTALEKSGSTISAEFGQGKWNSTLAFGEADAETRADAVGRYTVELPAGAATDGSVVPEGTGWVALKVREDGTAKVKGQLADGRSFSTEGTVVTDAEGPVVTFFESLEDTRVVGSFTLGDSVGGSLHVDRTSSDDRRFPDGYDVSQSASGARYIPPGDGQRALDSGGASTKELTITFSGGDLSGDLIRHLRLDDDDNVTVTDRGSEQLKVSIDRKSGRFKTGVTIDTDGTRVKGNGVLIQETGTTTTASGGRGTGVFNGSMQTGRIEIAPGAVTSTPTPTTPTTPATPAEAP